MTNAPFHTRDELLEWMGALPPGEQIHVARMLADTRTTGALAALADATVYNLSRTIPIPMLAEQLDQSIRQLRRAVDAHRRRMDSA